MWVLVSLFSFLPILSWLHLTSLAFFLYLLHASLIIFSNSLLTFLTVFGLSPTHHSLSFPSTPFFPPLFFLVLLFFVSPSLTVWEFHHCVVISVMKAQGCVFCVFKPYFKSNFYLFVLPYCCLSSGTCGLGDQVVRLGRKCLQEEVQS